MATRAPLKGKVLQKMTAPTSLDRRGDERIPTIGSCFYELACFRGKETVDFTDGYALSLNTSSGGILLLMALTPEKGQVFELHVPSPTKGERTVKVVEACWTRELLIGAADKVYLVGVRSLFEPAVSIGSCA
jgi:hypothetical protein